MAGYPDLPDIRISSATLKEFYIDPNKEGKYTALREVGAVLVQLGG